MVAYGRDVDHETKVAQLAMIVIGQEDIVRLDIAVYEVVVMEVFRRLKIRG